MAEENGNDLLTAVFQADKLSGTYQQYAVPSAKVYIGKPAQELVQAAGVQIESIRVSLNLDAAASAELSVTNIWDDQKNAVKEGVKSQLVCGAMIRIELGYGSELTDVFHGFIYETGMQFSDMPSMQVTVMDVKRLMADNSEIDRVWEEQTLSSLFSTLMGRYEAFGLSISTEQKDSIIKSFIQRGSDLNLVRKLCREQSLRFVVYGEKAKLVSKSEEASVLTLSWGKNLISFSKNNNFVNTEIVVRGTLEKPAQKNSSDVPGGESQGATSGSPGNAGGSSSTGGGTGGGQAEESGQKNDVIEKRESVLSDGAAGTGIAKSIKVIEMTNVKGEDEVTSRLDDEVESLKESMDSGRGSCIGMPVLIPGRYLSIGGIDQSVDGDYYIKAVSHTFGSDGFTTDFTLGGKK